MVLTAFGGQSSELSTDSLGAWIKSTRSRLHLSQKDLAERAGLSRSYICDIERGRSTTPSMASLNKIAAAMGVARADLLGAAGILEQPMARRGDDGEHRLLTVYRDLSASNRHALERFARFLHDEEHRFVQPVLVEPQPEGERREMQFGVPLFELPE